MRTAHFSSRLGVVCVWGCLLRRGGVCLGGVSAHGGVCLGGVYPEDVCPEGCLPRGVSTQGVSAQRGVCLGGVCLGGVCHTPYEQNDCQTGVKTLPCPKLLLRVVNMDFWSQEPFYWPNTNTITKNTKWRPFKIILSDWHIVWVFKILTAKWHITMIPPPPSIRCVTP